MAITATFKVDEIITKVDKKIPFTDEIIKAGSSGNLVGVKYGSTYILKFSENFTEWLYLEYGVSELNIKGELKSIDSKEAI